MCGIHSAAADWRNARFSACSFRWRPQWGVLKQPRLGCIVRAMGSADRPGCGAVQNTSALASHSQQAVAQGKVRPGGVYGAAPRTLLVATRRDCALRFVLFFFLRIFMVCRAVTAKPQEESMRAERRH